MLVLAGLVWMALHLGVAGSSLRTAIVRRTGEQAFRAGFSLLSVATLVWLILAYRVAATELIWFALAGCAWCSRL